MSSVLPLIDRMFFTASRPKPVIATSRTATTVMIFARIEKLLNIREPRIKAPARADATAPPEAGR